MIELEIYLHELKNYRYMCEVLKKKETYHSTVRLLKKEEKYYFTDVKISESDDMALRESVR